MKSLAATAAEILDEKLMILLSLVTLATAVIQLLQILGPAAVSFLDLIDWAIVGVFVIEYVSKLYLSDSRGGYARLPWNILNLLIILLALTGFLFNSPLLYSAPLLRIVRVTKLFTESGRSSHEIRG